MSIFSKSLLIFLLFALASGVPAWADQDTGEAGAKAEKVAVPEQPDTDKKARKKDKEPKDPNRGRFLPIPIFITEPAIGEGLGLALVFFHRAKDNPGLETVASPNSIGNVSKEQTPPPTFTGVFAARTSNETTAGGIGHANSFRDDHIRFTGVAAVADVNSTLYILDQPFKFNLEGVLVYQDTKFRLGDSRWFLGVGLSYLDATNTFKHDLPDEAPVDLYATDMTNAGIAAKIAWDARDNTSMPNYGQLFEMAFWRYDESFGGDYNFWNTKLKMLTFHQLHEKFVLGGRLELSAIDGKAPFFAVPWVTLRGIPALRFQGERVVTAEIEARYTFTPRWALIGFAGTGWVSSGRDFLDTEEEIFSYGLGGRYKILEAQNIWVGIDIARGPEEWNWYIQVGHAW